MEQKSWLLDRRQYLMQRIREVEQETTLLGLPFEEEEVGEKSVKERIEILTEEYNNLKAALFRVERLLENKKK